MRELNIPMESPIRETHNLCYRSLPSSTNIVEFWKASLRGQSPHHTFSLNYSSTIAHIILKKAIKRQPFLANGFPKANPIWTWHRFGAPTPPPHSPPLSLSHSHILPEFYSSTIVHIITRLGYIFSNT